MWRLFASSRQRAAGGQASRAGEAGAAAGRERRPSRRRRSSARRKSGEDPREDHAGPTPALPPLREERRTERGTTEPPATRSSAASATLKASAAPRVSRRSVRRSRGPNKKNSASQGAVAAGGPAEETEQAMTFFDGNGDIDDDNEINDDDDDDDDDDDVHKDEDDVDNNDNGEMEDEFEETEVEAEEREDAVAVASPPIQDAPTKAAKKRNRGPRKSLAQRVRNSLKKALPSSKRTGLTCVPLPSDAQSPSLFQTAGLLQLIAFHDNIAAAAGEDIFDEYLDLLSRAKTQGELRREVYKLLAGHNDLVGEFEACLGNPPPGVGADNGKTYSADEAAESLEQEKDASASMQRQRQLSAGVDDDWRTRGGSAIEGLRQIGVAAGLKTTFSEGLLLPRLYDSADESTSPTLRQRSRQRSRQLARRINSLESSLSIDGQEVSDDDGDSDSGSNEEENIDSDSLALDNAMNDNTDDDDDGDDHDGNLVVSDADAMEDAVNDLDDADLDESGAKVDEALDVADLRTDEASDLQTLLEHFRDGLGDDESAYQDMLDILEDLHQGRITRALCAQALEERLEVTHEDLLDDLTDLLDAVDAAG